MKDHKFLFLTILGCSIFSNSVGQTQTENNFVIITFASTYKISQHGKQEFYWIVPCDSLQSKDNKLSRLFVEPVSQVTIEECETGVPFDPRVIFANSSYDVSQEYINKLDTITHIISANRKIIQKITKKWANGQVQKIVIYATPIKGKFCSSCYHLIGQNRTGYKGRVFLPLSNFSLFGDFWTTAQALFLMAEDFSRFQFDVISN